MTDLTIQKTNETKTLPYIIRQLIEQRLIDCHFCLPGKVEKYDRKKRKADIKPLLKRGDTKQSRSMPVIPNVPVCMYSSSNNTAFIDFPVKKGDTGIILFSERSLDLWLVQGGEIDPNDTRKFDLSDGIFIPGMNPFNVSMAVEDDDGIIIYNDKCKISIKANGDFIVKDSANNSQIKMEGGKFAIGKTDELLQQISDQLSKIMTFCSGAATHVHIGNLGYPSAPPTDASPWTTLSSDCSTIKGKIDGIKGSL